MHILVSLADSCSRLVQASHGDTHVSTCSDPQDASGTTYPSGQPASQPSFQLGYPLPTTSQKPSILLRVGVLWFPLKCGLQDHVVSNYGLSPWQIPHLGLYFHTLTAQPPLTGCENITMGQPDRNTGKGVVSQKRSMGHLHTH